MPYDEGASLPPNTQLELPIKHVDNYLSNEDYVSVAGLKAAFGGM